MFAAIAICLGIAWTAWVAFDDPEISADVYAYDVVSDSRTVVTLEVRRPEPIAVVCTVQAQSEDHSVVGERTIELAASEESTERLEIDIQTQRRAVTAILRECRTA